jgi:hypothetical protein
MVDLVRELRIQHKADTDMENKNACKSRERLENRVLEVYQLKLAKGGRVDVKDLIVNAMLMEMEK